MCIAPRKIAPETRRIKREKAKGGQQRNGQDAATLLYTCVRNPTQQKKEAKGGQQRNGQDAATLLCTEAAARTPLRRNAA